MISIKRKDFSAFLFSLLFLPPLIGQREIQINDTFLATSINPFCLAIKTPVKDHISRDSIWKLYLKGEFKNFETIIEVPKYKIGFYDIWMLFIIENKSSAEIPLFVKSFHVPTEVYKKTSPSWQLLKSLGHAAQSDPNSILSIKERNGFSDRIVPYKTDTFLMNVNIIEAGESSDFYLYQADRYCINKLKQVQWPTLFNGLFIGIIVMLLLTSLYFYFRIKERFLIWYIGYLSIFIFYYWRDLEFWNTQYDISHQFLSWHVTKVPITLIIFTFYLLFINGILNIRSRQGIRKFLNALFLVLPGIFLLDFILLKYYPYGSNILAYTCGLVMGIIQLSLLYPIWKTSQNDWITRFLILGSLCLFLGWLTILLFPIEIHQYTVRLFTLIEMLFFMLAIAERFMKIKNEMLELKLTEEKTISMERNRIAGELHDEVGATLSGISMYSYLMNEQLKLDHMDLARQSLEIIQQSARDMVNKLNDIVWFINPDQDSLEKLLERLQEYTRKMGTIKQMQINFDVPDHLTNSFLPDKVKRNIYLIYKEAVNNAVKYSEASILNIKAKNNFDELEIVLKDNGKGFDTLKIKKGNGLQNMKVRAKEICADLIIASRQDQGCEITLKFKIAS
ncbi:MAG: 7TM diverse intracellular signaling domain-containing protein [Saprospiraceae bacterium]